jgi:heme oxygenase
MSILLDKLQGQTREGQARLDGHPALHRLLQADVTSTAYAGVLGQLFGFYFPLEIAYEQSPACLLLTEFFPRQATKNLMLDVLKQGVNPNSLPLETLQEPFFGLEEAIAFLYLRESLTLNGRAISENLEKTLGILPDRDNRFFAERGKSTDAAFTGALAQVEGGIDADKTVQFAVQLFKRLENWLDKGVQAGV